MKLILLTPEQADKLRGPSADGSAALEPRELSSSDFILPARVIEDPAHEKHHDFLAKMPIVDSGEVEFPEVEE